MNKILMLFALCASLLFPAMSMAQNADETLVEFFSEKATMEDDPNHNNYNITIFSPDGQWKMQLNYTSENMFGTFGNKEFRMDGNGKNYNYVRNPKNDMVFYSFVDMNVTVADEGSLYRVKANCLTSNKMRFIVEATIPAPKAKETRTDNLGYARVQPNSFYGTYAIYAENENYKVAYGIVGSQLTGTFYRADMLMPELYDKKAGKDIKVLSASAEHKKDGDNTLLTASILSDDLIMYELSMFNGPYDIEIQEERNINFTEVILQDISEMYGCYQFGAQNKDYQLAIAISSEAFTSGKTEWTKDDLLMQYTNLLLRADNSMIDIFDIKVRMEKLDKLVLVYADITSMYGILYNITMRYEEEGYMPAANDTVNIDFGHVAVLDYSQGMGIVGIGAVKPGQYQMRFYMYTPELKGEFTNSDFIMDNCDVMVVTGNTYVFHDAKYMKANMEQVDGKTLITVDMLGVDQVLYHGTMEVGELRCMKDGEYPVDVKQGTTMIALQMGYADDYGEYNMQLQNIDNVYDDDDNIVGDGYLFSFYFPHNGPGVSGLYGISDGTLADDQVQMFFENGAEIRVGTVACTLDIKPIQPVTFTIYGQRVNSYLYDISFKLLGMNGVIYSGTGQNYLICINMDGDFIDITEDKQDAIEEALAEEGYKVRKFLKDGKIVVEKADRQYDMQGRALK